jgi:LacI family transcriptional regulator
MNTDRITVKGIAHLAGVSIGTVDRVLHDRGGVSLETKEKIEGIITDLGFTPNILARQLSLNKTYTFRVVLPRADQDSGYWELCLSGIHRAERDLEAYRVQLRIDDYDRYDAAARRKVLEDVASDPCDGLLLAPVMPEELMPILELLGDEERPGGAVPYAFFDGDLEGALPVAVVAQDPFRGGYLAGRVMSLLAPGEKRLVALSAHAGDQHIERRIEGFRAFFRDAGRATRVAASSRQVVAVECLGLEDASSRDAFLSALFRKSSEIAGILVANSSGHFVGDWLSDQDMKAHCAVVSWDTVPANLRALAAGSIDCVVSQRPAEQAREAMIRLFMATAQGATKSDPVTIPLEVFFKENLP